MLLTFPLTDDDRSFVEELFKEHRALFLNVARQILDSFAEAEDAVSEAMIRIITNLDKISALPRHKIRSYCIVIVRNCALARFRKAGEIPTEMSIAVNDSLIQPEEAFLEQEQAKELQDIIRALSREERMLLQLRYVDDANYKEIADILGITEETARKRTERILRKLRELLKKDRHNG